MHDLEPYYHWRDYYVAAEDELSPFFGHENDLFVFRNKVYNYIIHPEWDEFGSSTLYCKVLYVDYTDHTAIIELLGEWDDCLQNDIMYLKRNIIDHMIDKGIRNFVLIAENVLNFHAGDDDYYEEWGEDVDGGWIILLNALQHVREEMQEANIPMYIRMGDVFDDFNWRKHNPIQLIQRLNLMMQQTYLR